MFIARSSKANLEKRHQHRAPNCALMFRSFLHRVPLDGALSSIRSGYGALRILLAMVLLVAAALKGYELITAPIIGTNWLDARWLLLVTVEFEFFLSFWLLSNLLPKPTWTAALVCFGLFTCGSLYKALSGYASCDCFGRVPVNPWYTSLFDLSRSAKVI